jgi:hypothetical protein
VTDWSVLLAVCGPQRSYPSRAVSAELANAERWVLERLADDDHHFADLAWLGDNQYRTEEAMVTLLSLLANGYVQVRECYEGERSSRLLAPLESKDAIADERNWPRSTSRRAHWYEASATESGLIALWGPRERPYRDRYLP